MGKGETTGKRGSIITPIALLLFIGSVVYLTVEMGRNSRLEDELKTEKLTSEILLSEKLFMEKEIMKLKEELKSIQTQNSELDNQLKGLAKSQKKSR
jgi:hypothetical protein